jgi:hypothetical protein
LKLNEVAEEYEGSKEKVCVLSSKVTKVGRVDNDACVTRAEVPGKTSTGGSL